MTTKNALKKPIVIVGLGELGGEFARGFLRCGYPVYPVTRQISMDTLSQHLPDPALVLITVQEKELHKVLSEVPAIWRDKIALVQNELLPRDWQQFDIHNPTVAVVWFEKKPDMVLTNILYTPVFGPASLLMMEALDAIQVPTKKLENESELLYELLRKSLYILTVNICGLVENCSVGELWEKHSELAREVAHEAIKILAWLSQSTPSEEKLIAGMVEGIADCPHRKCLGRSAKSRLERALSYAKQAGIAVPKMEEIYQKYCAS